MTPCQAGDPGPSRRGRRLVGCIASVLFLVLVLFLPATRVSGQARPPKPFAPDWSMIAGWDVFAKKGCGTCHAVRGVGATIGPDLGRIKSGRSFFEVAATMWNHLPRMGAKWREVRFERPQFTAREMSDLIAFLFTAQYADEPGDVVAGEARFVDKGCVQCHEVGGRGGRVGPGLDFLKRASSPVLIAAAMWNHGPEMADTMEAKGIRRPTFEGRQLVDLVAYITSVAKGDIGDSVQIIPGTPDRGQKLFADKRCVVCHTVGASGGTVGPKLGTVRHHVSLTGFATLMWNHAPHMWAEMRERGVQVPRLTGQEMADIVAYLYTSHYFDEPGDATRGRQVLDRKRCLTCHAIRGKGGTVSADFAKSVAVRSPASLVAAMWNHSGFMETRAREREVPWPALTGSELDDLAAYLGSLSVSRRAK